MTGSSPPGVDHPADQAAERLWERFLNQLPISWSGSTALDLGCRQRNIPRYLVRQRQVAVCHGVHLPVHGELVPGEPDDVPGVQLHVGRLDRIAALRDIKLDIVICTATVPLLRPAELDGVLSWILEHLNPGGVCVLDVEPITSHAAFGADLRFATALAHLVFSRREIDRYLSDRGEEPLPYHNPSCGATYLMQFKRAGFELLHVNRHANPAPDLGTISFPDKLQFFDEQELATARLDVMMRKPLCAPDLTMIDGYVAET